MGPQVATPVTLVIVYPAVIATKKAATKYSGWHQARLVNRQAKTNGTNPPALSYHASQLQVHPSERVHPVVIGRNSLFASVARLTMTMAAMAKRKPGMIS